MMLWKKESREIFVNMNIDVTPPAPFGMAIHD